MTELAITALVRREARTTIAHHSKSFALASALLGRRLRDETAVIYTWCRRADDAVDEHPAAGDEIVARLRAELAEAYAGRATDPVLAAFGRVCRERAIPLAYPAALLDGMAQDVHHVPPASFAELHAYAYRVASTVGLMMTHVFGVFDDAAVIHAAHLGIAMQLTNICRDVAEDAARGRRYLPPDTTVAELLATADRYYASGDRGLRFLPLRPAIAVRAARDIYRAIGPRILAQRGAPRRAVVGKAAKLGLAATAAARMLATAPPRIVRGPAHPPTRTLELADVPCL